VVPTWSRNKESDTGSDKHLLKRFLTRAMFDALKYRVTLDYGASLLDVIKGAVDHLDASGHAGIVAPDQDAYRTFRPLLHPVVCTLNDANPDTKQIRTRSAEWTTGIGEPTTGLETDSKSGPITVESVAVRVSRSLKGYPFQPKMNIDHYKQMEKYLKSAFKKISSPQSKDEALSNGLATDVPGVGAVLGGTYYALDKIPSGLERQLDRDGLLFDPRSDPIHASANMCNHWPTGRGIFLIGSTAHVIGSSRNKKREVSFMWINESDHVKLIIGRKDDDIFQAFKTASEVLRQLEGVIEMVEDPDFGYLTTSPGLVGTGLQLSARVRLPFLGSEPIFRHEVCQQHDLLCQPMNTASATQQASTKSASVSHPHRPTSTVYEVSNRKKFGLTEPDILHSFVRGVREIIDIEERYRQK